MDETASIADNLRVVRARLRMTQAQAAQAAGVSRRVWAAWEGGETRVDAEALRAFCRETRVDVSEVYR